MDDCKERIQEAFDALTQPGISPLSIRTRVHRADEDLGKLEVFGESPERTLDRMAELRDRAMAAILWGADRDGRELTPTEAAVYGGFASQYGTFTAQACALRNERLKKERT